MIDHLVVLETRRGAAEVIAGAVAGWDARGAPGVISLVTHAQRNRRRDCHTLFQLVAAEIELFLVQRSVRPPVSRLIILVDLIRWPSLDPMDTAGTYEEEKSSPLIALLVLAFPEVLWGFAETRGALPSAHLSAHVHRLPDWLASENPPPLDPLMDVTGLRDFVRRRAGDHLTGGCGEAALPFRDEWAVAVDDESAFAYFNAYTEYRHGFRAGPICTWSAASYLLGAHSPMTTFDHEGHPLPPTVTFEDLFLGFPDPPPLRDFHLSNLDQRDKELPVLATALRRVIVTSGHRQGGTATGRAALRRRGATRVLKPTGGMFHTWSASGLRAFLRKKDRERARWVGGYAHGYHPILAVKPNQKVTGHSAPGALLAVAELLMERAERVKAEIVTVEDVVRGAVLAIDAFELLASRTPILCLDALALKHELEARAECLFSGVQNHLDLRTRLRKVQSGVRVLADWYDPWYRDVACWNAEILVLSRLRAVFGTYDQVDEQEQCLARTRTLHRRLWFRQHFGKVLGTWLRWFNPFYWVASYVSLLLSSIPWFVFMVAIWISGLTVGFYEAVGPGAESISWGQSFVMAFSTFVSVGSPLSDPNQPPHNLHVHHPECYYSLACFGMAIGFLHLGIFISQLYSSVSRKN